MAMEGNGADRGDGHDDGLDAGGDSDDPIARVRVVTDPDPAAAAHRLAADTGGTVFGDFDTLRAQALLSQAGGPQFDEAVIAELRELADAIDRTERIRLRTEVEFTETLNRRLSASSGVAVHPETIRQAGLALTEAEREVADITKSITELGDRPRPEAVQLDAPTSVPHMFDDESLEQQRRARVVALAVLAFFGGFALVLLNFATVIVPIAVLAVGVVLAAAMFVRSFRRGPDDDPDAREASALLAAATGNVERTGEASARDRMAEEEWMGRRAQLEAARERAEERARSARRHWETLAGADADPYDLDSVLRIHDPQFLITGAATKTSPTVRTVNAVHRKAMARWKVAWAALGYESPPPLDQVDEHLDLLQSAAATDMTAVDHPLILVEPEDWLPEDELHALLHSLPPGTDVIVVTR